MRPNFFAGSVLAAVLFFSGSATAVAGARVVVHRTTANFAMPGTGLATVQSITLPAGSWSVWAKATAMNPGDNVTDAVRCALYDVTAAKYLDASTVAIGKPAYRTIADIPLVATLTIPAGATRSIQQRCGHDTTAGSAAYLQPEATLLGMLALATGASPQGSVVTTAATPLPKNAITTVVTDTLPAGRYLVAVKFVTVTQTLDVYCTLSDGVRTVDITPSTTRGFLSPNNGDWVGPSVALMVSSGGTVKLACSNFMDSGVYIDPAAVLWHRQIADFEVASTMGCDLDSRRGTTPDLVVGSVVACPTDELPAASVITDSVAKAGNWVALGLTSVTNYAGYTINFPDPRARTVDCSITAGAAHLDHSASNLFVGNQVLTLGTGKLLAAETNVQGACTVSGMAQDSSSIATTFVLLRP